MTQILQVRSHEVGKRDVALASVSLSQVSYYIVTGVWHEMLSELGYNLGMPPSMGRLWIGHGKMDLRGGRLNVGLNFSSAPEIWPGWAFFFFSRSYKNRCWWFFIIGSVSWVICSC